MFGIIHHYWSSCFIKYNTNSVEMWLISLYVLTQFYSVAIFNWEKRMCRQDFGFIEYPLCHWPRKQMKNEIKIMRMRYRIIDTPFFLCGWLRSYEAHLFLWWPKPPLSLPCVHWKQSFFLNFFAQLSRFGSLLSAGWDSTLRRGQQSGQENHMSIRNEHFFLTWK